MLLHICALSYIHNGNPKGFVFVVVTLMNRTLILCQSSRYDPVKPPAGGGDGVVLGPQYTIYNHDVRSQGLKRPKKEARTGNCQAGILMSGWVSRRSRRAQSNPDSTIIKFLTVPSGVLFCCDPKIRPFRGPFSGLAEPSEVIVCEKPESRASSANMSIESLLHTANYAENGRND